MSQTLVECVPNFSEGRDPSVIEAIAAAMRAVEGAMLLDVDPGAATNRTVMTLIGPPEAVLEAAFQGMATAQRLIDMRGHEGEHARMGATDVCPFVPVAGIDRSGCVELARRLGARVGEELGIPVYLYEWAASSPDRENLATVRAGEYEGLQARLASSEWQADHGPSTWSESVARSGATVIGARPFLIAWNINLNTRNKRLAMKVAAALRTRGRLKRDADRTILRDSNGNALRVPGRFAELKGVGWFIEEYDRAQLSFNLTNHEVSSLHDVFDAAVEVAAAEGIRVTGSELVGLVPREALLSAGRHYLRKQGSSLGCPEAQVVATAIQSLGLEELSSFDPAERVIEYRIAGARPLAAMTLGAFADKTSSDAPAPGGGSVAALCGALGGALAAMVGNLTIGRRNPGPNRARLEELAVAAQTYKDRLLRAVDDDTAAFDEILVARRLPKASADQRAVRLEAIEAATQRATEVPLEVVRSCAAIAGVAEEVSRLGMSAALSDAGVAALASVAGAEGAAYNVLINLADVKDQAFEERTRSEALRLLAEARSAGETTRNRVMAGLS